jgi:hypothetical protein
MSAHAQVRGMLHAADKQIPLELDARIRAVDGGLEIEAVTTPTTASPA